jgi:hypothetical protein
MYREIARITVRHAYYDPAPVPVRLVPDDAEGFAAQGMLLKLYNGMWHVLTDAVDVPDALVLRVVAQTPEVLSVTDGAMWDRTPIVAVPLGQDATVLETVAAPTQPRNPRAGMVLAQLEIALGPVPRAITLGFEAVASHWAYHVVGEGADASEVHDPEGVVAFVRVPASEPPMRLPDGRPIAVLRSTQALPARARTPHRFALQTPGSFGPRTLIPVLPAPGPDFVSRSDPASSETQVQSDIYVSIV